MRKFIAIFAISLITASGAIGMQKFSSDISCSQASNTYQTPQVRDMQNYFFEKYNLQKCTIGYLSSKSQSPEFTPSTIKDTTSDFRSQETKTTLKEYLPKLENFEQIYDQMCEKNDLDLFIQIFSFKNPEITTAFVQKACNNEDGVFSIPLIRDPFQIAINSEKDPKKIIDMLSAQKIKQNEESKVITILDMFEEFCFFDNDIQIGFFKNFGIFPQFPVYINPEILKCIFKNSRIYNYDSQTDSSQLFLKYSKEFSNYKNKRDLNPSDVQYILTLQQQSVLSFFEIQTINGFEKLLEEINKTISDDGQISEKLKNLPSQNNQNSSIGNFFKSFFSTDDRIGYCKQVLQSVTDEIKVILRLQKMSEGQFIQSVQDIAKEMKDEKANECLMEDQQLQVTEKDKISQSQGLSISKPQDIVLQNDFSKIKLDQNNVENSTKQITEKFQENLSIQAKEAQKKFQEALELQISQATKEFQENLSLQISQATDEFQKNLLLLINKQ